VLASIDYAFYCEYVHRGLWIPARHLELVCSNLEEVERGILKRLMIYLPPRHGKSMSCTETFPSYFIGKNPERRVIEVSYGDDLARRFGKFNRQKIEEFGNEIFRVQVAKDQASMTNFDIEGHRGGMISVGVGGPITGQGADLLLIDDPIKNREQADSETYREKIWSEWQNTLRTRLHPNAAVILIITRWHEDDLAGRLLNPEYGEVEDWEIVSLPAEAEAGDLLGRDIGEPLWPEHGFDKHWMNSTKAAVGSRAWNALYQQRPTPAEGSLLKRGWWQWYDKPPDKFDRVVQSWDCSFKDSDGSDYVVGQVWGMKGIDCYLLDQVRGRMDMPTTVEAVEMVSEKWPDTKRKFIEDKANGPAVMQILSRKLSGIIAVNPEGGKLARASAVSPHIESGHVFLPKFYSWAQDFVEEAAAFPNGQHDDQVDAMTQAINQLMYYREREEPQQLTGTYAWGELAMNGYSDAQIRRMVNRGGIKLIGGRPRK